MGKEFAWSFSKLKNFETCPLRHEQVDLKKTFTEKQDPDGPLAWGNRVHTSMADALGKNVPLPAEMVDYQKWIDRVRAGPGQLLIEQKYAITREFKPTQYFAPNVWYRGIGDVVRIDEPVALILDWKTGKIKVDSVQLILMAQCIFSHFPSVQKVRSEFVWLAEDCSTPEHYTRQGVAAEWPGLLTRVEALEHAYNTKIYLPTPSRLCRQYCPVTTCAHHGKSYNG